MHAWSKQWLVNLNPSKTESLIFSRKRNKSIHPQLVIDNTPITEVSDHRHLGITFSNDYSLDIHIVKITTTAWQRINIFRAFKFKLDRKSLERMYISFIRPILEYSGAIWDNCSNEDSKLLEAVQIEAENNNWSH